VETYSFRNLFVRLLSDMGYSITLKTNGSSFILWRVMPMHFVFYVIYTWMAIGNPNNWNSISWSFCFNFNQNISKSLAPKKKMREAIDLLPVIERILCEFW